MVQAGAWVRPEERDKVLRQLKAEGRVRNFETELRFRGVVAPYLMSSVLIEIDGELHALNVARDATSVKENERALCEMQERLRAQVDRLTSTEVRLRAEVVEREAAERIARERENTVRKVFEPEELLIHVDEFSVAESSQGHDVRHGVEKRAQHSLTPSQALFLIQ